MAISKTISIKEINIDNCYIKVASTNANKFNAVVSVLYKANKEADPIFSEDFVFPVDLNGDNFIKQAYKHMKTLPQFSDAVDC